MQVPEAENLSAPVERRRSVKYRRLASEEWKDDGRRKPNTHNEETRSLGVSPAKRDVGSRRYRCGGCCCCCCCGVCGAGTTIPGRGAPAGADVEFGCCGCGACCGWTGTGTGTGAPRGP